MSQTREERSSPCCVHRGGKSTSGGGGGVITISRDTNTNKIEEKKLTQAETQLENQE